MRLPFLPGGAMTNDKSILTISRDLTLQALRGMILRQAGYQVSSAISDEQAIGFVEAPNSFGVALLCHSVPESSRVYLVNRIKELNSTLPILMLYNEYDPTRAKVDGSLHSLEGPGAWLEMITFLISGTKGSPAHL